jgi:hypothetical protein
MKLIGELEQPLQFPLELIRRLSEPVFSQITPFLSKYGLSIPLGFRVAHIHLELALAVLAKCDLRLK